MISPESIPSLPTVASAWRLPLDVLDSPHYVLHPDGTVMGYGESVALAIMDVEPTDFPTTLLHLLKWDEDDRINDFNEEYNLYCD